MTMLNQVKKIAKQKTIHMSFRNTLEESNLYNEIMRRATLTNTDLAVVCKEYCTEGVKKDKFLLKFR